MPRVFQTRVGEMSLPASGWLYCGCWEFSVFSNTFPLLLSKRFGVFLCNLSMCSEKNNSKAPTQKPLLKRPAITCTTSPIQVTALSLQAGRQGLVGPPSCHCKCLGSRQSPCSAHQSKCGTEKGTSH